MPEELKDMQKAVGLDWRKALPELSQYAYNKFYKIIGPVIVGIELIKLPYTREYRPHFVVYPLWGDDIKSCLQYPIILQEFRGRKGLQIDIDYEKHSSSYQEAVGYVKAQMSVTLDGNILLGDLLKLFNDYSKQPPLSVAPNSYLQAALHQQKLCVALYSGVNNVIDAIVNDIQTRNWDKQHFALCKIDMQKWLLSISELAQNRDSLLKKITVNKQDKKIARLSRSEVILA